MTEIDEVRRERDGYRSSNAQLRADNARLADLLEYAKAAIVGEYRLRVDSDAPEGTA